MIIYGVNQTNVGQNRHYIASRKLVVHFPKPNSGSTIKGPLITVAIDDTVWEMERDEYYRVKNTVNECIENLI